ncbi:hypothetical protein HYH03_007107 [Edaphochlamys debaryana]|uniref:Acyltransferase n=1 Tax=Edaphochlamys debaryana TaxID=47281 RepID=A0A835Y2S8_9CHLO|nr:hypothetical protein HYH03_007107 [Edaphochlamys debaryana]|eukprot:KAG2494868.1 hypothetical protein HYH03_007107 [Edaphochlamys debaryana]
MQEGATPAAWLGTTGPEESSDGSGVRQRRAGPSRADAARDAPHRPARPTSLGAKLLDYFLEWAAVGIYVTGIYVSGLLLPLALMALWFLGPASLAGWTLLCLFLFLTFVPLPLITGAHSDRFIRFSVRRAVAYFPLRLEVADPAAFRPDTPYVFGFCPHSALPLALPITFASCSELLPPELRGRTHGLASSVCFSAPIVRQLWWWLGIRPATRQAMEGLLRQGRVAVLTPGGVQEVLHMQHGKEVAYLGPRTGFVRIAIRCGAPLVPVFAFGQTRTYSWLRPGPPFCPEWLVQAISRTAGAVPVLMYGACGTPMPHREPMAVVIGKPIPVPELAEGEEPSSEVVEGLLRRFKQELQVLYDTHKAQYGRGEELIII